MLIAGIDEPVFFIDMTTAPFLVLERLRFATQNTAAKRLW
jgi:hypothetical protein